MEPTILEFAPQTPGEELRFESALRAVHNHESAKVFRTIVVVVAFAVATARISLVTSIGWPLDVLDTPAIYAICLFASLLAFSREWSTRLQCEDRTQAYAHYLLAHRQ